MKELSKRQLSALLRAYVNRYIETRNSAPEYNVCLAGATADIRSHLLNLNPAAKRNWDPNHDAVSAEIDMWMEWYKDDIARIVKDAIRKTLVKIKTREIAQATAEPRVRQILESKGIEKAGTLEQKHRIKVMVKLPNNRWFHFHIRYNHLQDDLARVGEAVDAAIVIANCFGHDTTIV